MKIPPARIESFVRSPPAGLRVALVFGPDSGAVKLYADALARTVVDDPADVFRISLLQSADIGGDPALLFDEMAAQSLGGGRRLVRVPHAEEKIAAALGKLLEDLPPGDSLLLLEAGELDKKSKLRALAEGKAESIAAITCYPAEGEDRTRLIGNWLRERKIAIAPDALQVLAAMTPPDRLALFSELEKLALYVGEGARIGVEEVQAALGDAASSDMDVMLMALGEGNRAALDAALGRLLAESVAPVAILRAAQRHFLRLLEARGHIDQGLGASEAAGKLYPPVFWKFKDGFARQLQKWQSGKIARALAALVEAEAQCKSTGLPDTILCAQLLTVIGSQSR